MSPDTVELIEQCAPEVVTEAELLELRDAAACVVYPTAPSVEKAPPSTQIVCAVTKSAPSEAR